MTFICSNNRGLETTCRMFRILGKLIIHIMRTLGEKYLQSFFLKIQDKRHSSVFVSVHVFKFFLPQASHIRTRQQWSLRPS